MTVQFNPKTGGRGIEWTDETRNATGGCKHDCKWEMPDGSIAVCYAKELAESGVAKAAYPDGFEHHYWREKTLKELPRGKNPLLIFPDSMSDMFASYVPSDQVQQILDAMRTAPHHTYQSLTKAPGMLLKYVDRLPANLWVGVSSPPNYFLGKRLDVRQQAAMLRKSLDVLREVKRRTGCIVWMSAEPVSWDISAIIKSDHPLDWIVIGAASNGPRTFQPNPFHILPLLKLMDETDTPVFYKGNIHRMFERHKYRDAELDRWREDFPLTDRVGKPIAAVAARQKNCERHGWTQSRDYVPRYVDAIGIAP